MRTILSPVRRACQDRGPPGTAGILARVGRWGVFGRARAGSPRLYGPPRNCKGEFGRASRFSCTLVSGLWSGNLGSRALMESAHASPHLPDGLEWAQRGLRLVACRSDLFCHRLRFFLATVGDLGAAWNRLVGVLALNWGTQRFPGPVHGRGPLNRQSAGGQAVEIAGLGHDSCPRNRSPSRPMPRPPPVSSRDSRARA